MTLTFLGTRGYIDVRTRLHRRHSALLVTIRGRRFMIDCGEDWRLRLRALHPDAILLTHAHPDHAGGLDRGAPCPVYATTETQRLLTRSPVSAWRTVRPRKPFRLCGCTAEAFRVIHSLRAPAVGYRISHGRAVCFYVPDVVAIPQRRAALRGVTLYIGDGARLTRPLVRGRGDVPFGHTSVQDQLDWCRREGVARALFTHCGTEVVAGDARRIEGLVRRMGEERGVDAGIARDGLEVELV